MLVFQSVWQLLFNIAQRIKPKTEAAKRILILFRSLAVFSVAEIVFITLIILGLEYALLVCEALQGFDCQHEETTFRAINLAASARCPDPVKDYNNLMRQYFRVIQSTDTVLIKAWQCKLVVTKEVAKWTWDRSAVTGTHWPLWQSVIKLDAKDCAKAVKDNEIRYEGLSSRRPKTRQLVQPWICRQRWYLQLGLWGRDGRHHLPVGLSERQGPFVGQGGHGRSRPGRQTFPNSTPMPGTIKSS
jgi:hypothetical protein